MSNSGTAAAVMLRNSMNSSASLVPGGWYIISLMTTGPTLGYAFDRPVPGADFIGTTDSRALQLAVNSQRALRLEPNGYSPNVIGGASNNYVALGLFGATIAGGGLNGPDYPGRDSNFCFNCENSVHANFGSIGGGVSNYLAAGWEGDCRWRR